MAEAIDEGEIRYRKKLSVRRKADRRNIWVNWTFAQMKIRYIDQ